LGGGLGFAAGTDAEIADVDEGDDEVGEAEEERVSGGCGQSRVDSGREARGDGLDEGHQRGDEAVDEGEGGGREHERKKNIVGWGLARGLVGCGSEGYADAKGRFRRTMV
jgi:hypothetical protein